MIVCRGGHVLKNPSHRAAGVGARPQRRRSTRQEVRDVVIVGARAGRAGRGGLRRVRGAGRAGPREHGARRAGGHQLAHRELPRLPHRHLRPGAGRARADAGREVRRRGGDRPHRRPPRLRQPALPALSLRRPGGADAHHRHRHRREVPEARSPVARALRGRGRLLQRHPPRGPALRGRGDRRSSAAATRPGRRRCSCRGVATRVHMLVRGPGPGREHVALPDPAHREHAEHRAAHAHADRGAGGRRRPRAGAVAARRHAASSETRAHPQPVPDDRRRSQHRLAGGLRAPRRQEVREDRRRSAPRGSRRAPTGRCPAGRT